PGSLRKALLDLAHRAGTELPEPFHDLQLELRQPGCGHRSPSYYVCSLSYYMTMQGASPGLKCLIRRRVIYSDKLQRMAGFWQDSSHEQSKTRCDVAGGHGFDDHGLGCADGGACGQDDCQDILRPRWREDRGPVYAHQRPWHRSADHDLRRGSGVPQDPGPDGPS